jgi:hypothetical protein
MGGGLDVVTVNSLACMLVGGSGTGHEDVPGYLSLGGCHCCGCSEGKWILRAKKKLYDHVSLKVYYAFGRISAVLQG